MRGWQAAVAGSVVMASTLVVLAAPEDRQMPYHGHLEQNGVRVNGPHFFRYRFYDAAQNGNPLAAASAAVAIQVADGKFSTTLSVPDAVAAAPAVFLQVEVGPTSGSLVTMPTRQRIFPSLSAMRGFFDGLFRVNNSITVEGSTLVLGTNDGRSTGTVTTQRALVHDTSDRLVINAGGDFEGGVEVGGTVVNLPNRMVLGDASGNAGVRSISFARDTGDEGNAGKVTYRGFGEAALTITGAGTTTSNRQVNLRDNVRVTGNLVVDGRISGQAQEHCDCESASLQTDLNGNVTDTSVSSGTVGTQLGINLCRGGRFLVGFQSAGPICANEAFGFSACFQQLRCCRPCNIDTP